MPAPAANAPARTQPSAQHQYGTRIRSNSVMRPSVRLRQDPDRPAQPRRIKPVPTPKTKIATASTPPPQQEFPPFPPAHVMLHSDDASSKVFMAIGRSFMSVDNCAMTIKDLSEMTMKYGLLCQNVSAAGQAITTYLRSHLQRCEVQQDHPLLLRHVLSGTVHDDDLVPALHSRTGGAHCSLNPGDTRVTNFRRGTMVWYLSRAAGAPCPFARAGIRLCDYNENGKTGAVPNPGKERKRERDRQRRAEQCGQKRKRLVRACADKDAESDFTSEEEQRPPKVKLTLRLRPSLVSASSRSTTSSAASIIAVTPESSQASEVADLTRGVAESAAEFDSDSESSDSESDSDGMSVDSSEEEEDTTQTSAPDDTDSSRFMSTYRRYPSVPYSVGDASVPPDSEEDDDYHISMIAGRSSSYFDDDEDDDIWDDSDDEQDSGADAETQWESPGPQSPEAFVDDDTPVRVKREPDAVGELLLQYERNALDAAFQQVAEDLVAEQVSFKPKVEEIQSPLEWDLRDGFALHEDNFVRVKQEEGEHSLHSGIEAASSSPQPLFPMSPLSASSVEYDSLEAQLKREVVWRNLEFLTCETRRELQSRENAWAEDQKLFPTSGSLAEGSQPLHPASFSYAEPVAGPSAPPTLDLLSIPPSFNVQNNDCSSPELATPSWIQSLTSLSIHSPTSPTNGRGSDPFAQFFSFLEHPESEASPVTATCDSPVHVCSANQAITARQLEGIYVYQLTLGPSEVALRRVDSDYVNFTHITRCFNFRLPQVPESVVVSRGSPYVHGIWLPRATMKRLVSAMDHVHLPLFLSDSLDEYFPPSLPESYRKAPSQPATFGRQFQSTAEEDRHTMQQTGLGFSVLQVGPHDDDTALRPFRLAGFPEHAACPEHTAIPDTPLSPTEEEMFHVLCAAPEWEAVAVSEESQDPPVAGCQPVEPLPLAAVTNCADEATAVVNPDPSPIPSKDPPCRDRPLRRSKRVAHAMTTRSRARSSKRGSRSSLA